jgi:hypothetical protein
MQAAREMQLRATRASYHYFGRLLFILLVMWGPWLFFWAYAVPYYVVGGELTWIAGSMAHLQGLVSAIIYLSKDDIRAEFFAAARACACACLLRTRPCAPEIVAASALDAVAQRKARRGYTQMVEQLDPRSARASRASLDLEVGEIQVGGRAGVAGRDSGRGAKSSGRRPGARAAESGELGATTAELSAARMRELGARAEEHILSHEKTHMMVLPWRAWHNLSAIPRSSSGNARPLAPTDVTIFVSHRWWASEEQRPDDAQDTKFRLICMGVTALIERHSLDPERVVIWIDFASVDQDDPDEQAKGIASLIAYAARSSYVLIPIKPTMDGMYALASAMHPIDLLDYGERAWCRMEIYVFLCIAEITHRPAAVYAYGNLDVEQRRDSSQRTLQRSTVASSFSRSSTVSSLPAASPARAGDRGREHQMLERAVARRSLPLLFERAGRCWHAAARFLENVRVRLRTRRQHLKPLLTTYSDGTLGAAFQPGEMPSDGELTFESEREQIAALERGVRQFFVEHAVLAETALCELRTGTNRPYRLHSKQLDCRHVPFLVSSLLSHKVVRDSIGVLDLQSNLLAAQGVRTLAQTLVLSGELQHLVELNLGFNVHLGLGGMVALAEMLSHPCCTLGRLVLSHCALEPSEGHALVAGLAPGRLLHLDVSYNLLDDLAVCAIMDACQPSSDGGSSSYSAASTTIVVEGNPISDSVHQVSVLLHMVASGLYMRSAFGSRTSTPHFGPADDPLGSGGLGQAAGSGRRQPSRERVLASPPVQDEVLVDSPPIMVLAPSLDVHMAVRVAVRLPADGSSFCGHSGQRDVPAALAPEPTAEPPPALAHEPSADSFRSGGWLAPPQSPSPPRAGAAPALAQPPD